jgi:hypothetical protein
MKYRQIILVTSILFIIIILCGCKSDSTGPSQSSNHINLIGSYNTPGFSYGIYVETISGIAYAFVADGQSGLEIINVTNRSNPILVSRFQTSGSAIDVTVALINSIYFAFISDGNQGLDILNISNISSPILDTTISINNEPFYTAFVDVQHRVAYAGTLYGNLYIYNLSNLPNSINQLSVYSTLDHILSVQVLDNLAYLGVASLGLKILDVSNPITPGSIGAYHPPSPVYNVKVSGNYAYLADGDNGILIIDVTNPFIPAFYSSAKTTGATYVGLAYNESFLYSADGNFGVEVFNVATPSSPLEVANYKTGDLAQNVFYYNGYIYVAASTQGLLILQYQP